MIPQHAHMLMLATCEINFDEIAVNTFNFLLPQYYILKTPLPCLMHFSSFGTTINSRMIVEAIAQYVPVFHISEMHLKPFL